MRLPDEVLWESIEVGLNSLISSTYGAAFWVKISFKDAFVAVQLWHAVPNRAGEVIYQISLPMALERDLPDMLLVASTVDGLYSALSDVMFNYGDPYANLMDAIKRLDLGEAALQAAHSLDELHSQFLGLDRLIDTYGSDAKPDNKHVRTVGPVYGFNSIIDGHEE